MVIAYVCVTINNSVNKNTKIALLAPLPFVMVGVIVGVAILITDTSDNNRQSSATVLSASTSTNTNSNGTSLDPNSGIVTLPLNQPQPTAENSSNNQSQLRVNNSSQSSSDPTIQQSQAQGSNNGSSSAASQNGAANSTSSSQKMPGTESFGQYDQYKDGQHALYADLQVGTGKELTANMKAAVAYKGWLTNGTLFDSSKTNSQGQVEPFVVTLGAHQVIPGWEEGLVGMKVGGSRRLVIPPAAGYGAKGQGPIPPNAVLVFDVALVEAL